MYLAKLMASNGTLKHNQELLSWSFMNVAVKIGYTGDYAMVKKMDKDKIDPAISTVFALNVLVTDEMSE